MNWKVVCRILVGDMWFVSHLSSDPRWPHFTCDSCFLFLLWILTIATLNLITSAKGDNVKYLHPLYVSHCVHTWERAKAHAVKRGVFHCIGVHARG